MNIVYINHYAGSVYHGMEYRPYYLAREWVRLGFKVTIVAASYTHLRQKNIVLEDGADYFYEHIDGIEYIWCRTPSYATNGLKRLRNIFVFLRRVYRLLPELAKREANYVIASSTYPFDTLLAHKLAKKTQAQFIYEVHDLWPLTPMELGGMSKYHPFIWLMQRAENYGYKYADKVVSLLPGATNYMQAHGMAKNKFVHVANGISYTDWLENQEEISVEYQQLIEQARQNYALLIGYAGSMGEANALDNLISVAVLKPQIAFMLVGDGANRNSLVNQVARLNLKNVFILAPIKKAQITNFLQRMDVLYIGWRKLPIYRFGVSPNKLFDYMLAARPILHAVTAYNDLVKEAHCGLSVPAEDTAAIAAAIDTYQHMPLSEREQLGINGYNYVRKHNDYSVLATKMLGVE